MNNTGAEEVFRRVLHKLLGRAKKNEVVWQKTKAGYLVQFPKSAIGLEFDQPEAESDYYIAHLYNDEGKLVENLFSCLPESDNWQLISALYLEAERSVTGWDRALSDAERALEEEEQVGRSSDDISDDDIPF